MVASSVSQKLADKGIMAGAGHYYAARLFNQIGLDPELGAVRLSFVHYTSTADMTKLIGALDEILES
jgi:selenocysteine lyase/cysteine desulfurase